RPPAASLGRGVAKNINEREPRQQCTDIFALNATALAVDQPHHGEASRTALCEIFLDDTANFMRSKRMQVENILQRPDDRVGRRIVAVNVFCWSCWNLRVRSFHS